ncbi:MULTISPECIES: LamG-like jellyroll fold domain-containing protein [unclassified Marinobacter]|uniref:LamG-like jellyroll fold domain-containing protein n=1 Tax=unclassified Marinobacter TaxID=83889 RepID=UPI0012680EA4|nr:MULTISPECIES: LamG-like jellyroll fold domain-containing protein [unclassified Marinobacter]QFS86635.1 hypothetical protein FIV08_07285 [Marinobacter sp. THAF197a]QFT50419.1 hypothetical protein FIU96_07215 [Marinobacter sp. THAF39]QFT52941.1 hypothetical protein FIU96_20020 [Marinobacter sp. THAF39]
MSLFALSAVTAAIRKVNQSVEGDPHWDKVVALLHFDGAIGSSDFEDESGFYHVITVEGTPTLEATSVFGQAGEFIVNEGLIFPDHPSLRMEDQDFTIEGFFQPASPGALSIVYMKGLNTSDGMLLSFSTSQIFMRNVDNETDLIKTVSLDSNTFYHVAFQRVGNLRQIWLDGQKVAEDSVIFNHSSIEPMTIGGYHPGVASGAYLFDGRIDEFRITKGVARYVSNFNVPTAPFSNQGVV